VALLDFMTPAAKLLALVLLGTAVLAVLLYAARKTSRRTS
jgi:hypothetical protein